MSDINLKLYMGNGQKISQRGEPLPEYEAFYDPANPGDYIAAEGLRNAVNLAIALGQPLLVTGEPGVGKTQLAASIANELELPPPLEFYTKTTTIAADLFYKFDALRRFQDSHDIHKSIDPESYITYQALGLAIILSNEPEESDPDLPDFLNNIRRPTRSVVLIDEIDKAPRDFPNDILNEIEETKMIVKETGKTFKADERFRPILIMTSNSEKNLPEPFLRRCLFYHIPFPDTEQLKAILRQKFKDNKAFTTEFIESAIERFQKIRKMDLKKPPATAELQAWAAVLAAMGVIDPMNPKPDQIDVLTMSYSILAKTQEDMHRLKNMK